ncbi:hypothetical protein D5F01_LYC00285 [Larimichthys crocea]|uniref:Uncharacterized protein n=1 Tax=Larimichthys crocea TaxID=215358 RepID=A0A6G0J8N9_LARCR|nr:hypothetical protein D5F01_LYC00285 [Larimichthys crocea]
METYTVLCPKRLHCISCQGLALGHINNIREQSPSPPPLSPIAPDINKKTDEKPPSLLHHRQEEEADLMVKDGFVNASHQEALMDTGTEEEQECRTPRSSRAEQNPSGTLLQDVVNRFSEKLETIRPVEKDPPSVSTVIYVSERELPQTPSTSQNLQFHADAHLTEIITTVLHTGSASDYNLSELFNRHDSKEPKSPNTRSRRRQEVLAAMATPADDASTRRQTLQIKRELAMLDQSYICYLTCKICFFTSQVCFFTIQVCFFTIQVCFFTIQVCFFTSQVCFFITQVCFIKTQVCFFTIQICFFTIQICFFTIQVCFVTFQVCVYVTQVRFLKTQVCFFTIQVCFFTIQV